MLSCVIIDDEIHCIDALSAMIGIKFSDKIIVAGSTNDPMKAAELIRNLNPDVVFMDVEMPGGNDLVGVDVGPAVDVGLAAQEGLDIRHGLWPFGRGDRLALPGFFK